VATNPPTISEFIVKIASRCNLNCSYCYVYNLKDTGWTKQPSIISDKVLCQLVARIKEYQRTHYQTEIRIILHGGEPLLAGPEVIRRVAKLLRASIPGSVRIAIQTNGILLDRTILDILYEYDIRIGISLDGNKQVNDRNRTFAHGGGSYDLVMAGLDKLLHLRGTGLDRNHEIYRPLFDGFLSVIDIRNDPIQTYSSLAGLGARNLDFLLPLGTHDSPPPGRTSDPLATPYGDWLVTLYDHWSRDPAAPDIRIFDVIMDRLLGAPGAPQANPIVVQTDGSLELLDALMSAYDGATKTGLNVFDNSFADMASHPGIVSPNPSQICQECHVFLACRAGYFPHRYKAINGFDNPSVYCADLMRLIEHIYQSLVQTTNELRANG
jgi:uncharacterized protein